MTCSVCKRGIEHMSRPRVGHVLSATGMPCIPHIAPRRAPEHNKPAGTEIKLDALSIRCEAFQPAFPRPTTPFEKLRHTRVYIICII